MERWAVTTGKKVNRLTRAGVAAGAVLAMLVGSIGPAAAEDPPESADLPVEDPAPADPPPETTPPPESAAPSADPSVVEAPSESPAPLDTQPDAQETPADPAPVGDVVTASSSRGGLISATATTKTFMVPGNVEAGVPTGIILKDNTVDVTCSGEARYAPTATTGCAGVSQYGEIGFIAGCCPELGLIARVGGGPWIKVGAGGPVTGTGELVFGYNDCAGCFFNNAGPEFYTVTVSNIPEDNEPPNAVVSVPVRRAVNMCPEALVDGSLSTDDGQIVDYRIELTPASPPLVRNGPQQWFRCFDGLTRDTTYTATLTVTDDEGLTDTASTTVHIGSLDAAIEVGQSAVAVGESSMVSLTATNRSDATLTLVRPMLEASETDGRVVLLTISGPPTPNLSPLAPGQSVGWTWTFEARRAGDVTFSGFVTGQDPVALENRHSSTEYAHIQVEDQRVVNAEASRGGRRYDQGSSTGNPLEDLLPEDEIKYRGTMWDPSGGPIRVFSDGQLIKTFPAAATFEGTFTFPGFDPDDPDCTTELVVRQDEETRRIRLSTDVGERVLQAAGLQLADGSPVPETTLCLGWNAGMPTPTGPWELVTESVNGRSTIDSPQVLAPGTGAVIRYATNSRWVQQGNGVETVFDAVPVYGPITLKGGPEGQVDIPSDGTRQLSDFDVTGLPNVTLVYSDPWNAEVDGFTRLQLGGDRTIGREVALQLSNASVFVDGSLELQGPVSNGFGGTGTLAALNDLVFLGEVHFRSFLGETPSPLDIFTGQLVAGRAVIFDGTAAG